MYVWPLQIFRHGDRSPIHIFPTDPYTEADWPQGFGQLSIVSWREGEREREITSITIMQWIFETTGTERNTLDL